MIAMLVLMAMLAIPAAVYEGLSEVFRARKERKFCIQYCELRAERNV